MLRRWITTTIIVWSGLVWAVATADAQDVAASFAQAMPKLTFATSVTAPAATPVVADTTSFVAPRPSFDTGSSHLSPLLPFYASTAVLQFLDVRSTLNVVKLGGSEANPMLQGVVGHPALFIGVKAAVAAVSIYAAHKLAKHNKVGAIATMVAMNSVYAMVVAHNYQLARSMASR